MKVWDNRAVKRFISLFLLLAACTKSSDLGALQEEAQGIVDRAKPEVAELEHRLAEVRMHQDRYNNAIDALEARNTIAEASGALQQLKAELAKKPAEIAEAAKGPDTARLQSIIDDGRAYVDNQLTIATQGVTTAENWLARNETEAAHPRFIPVPPEVRKEMYSNEPPKADDKMPDAEHAAPAPTPAPAPAPAHPAPAHPAGH